MFGNVDSLSEKDILVDDPRSSLLGKRLITENEEILKSLTSSNHHMFTKLRYLNGIAEGVESFDEIPLELNYQHLNGISFTKGCYTGQELIARTHFQGLLRKKVCLMRLSLSPKGLEEELDLEIDSESELEILEKQSLFNTETQKKRGKFLGGVWNQKQQIGLGLSLLKYDTNDECFLLENNKHSKIVKVF